MNDLPTLILMRGVPSSGKSYRAAQLAAKIPDTQIVSADDYYGHTVEEYVRNWHPSTVAAAHEGCQKRVERAMTDRVPCIIVDNTNLGVRAMRPYVLLSMKHEYQVRLEEPLSPWWYRIRKLLEDKSGNLEHLRFETFELERKSRLTHCVPYETILRMLLQFETDITEKSFLKFYTHKESK